jgi:uncharacterized protein YndB with AHSA1/START domain
MTAMTTTEPIGVRLQRTFRASPAEVYRAWLDPELIGRWLSAANITVTRAEVDERVGGRLSVWHANADGEDTGGMEAEILELVPGERLVFDWHFVGPERQAGETFETCLTVTLRQVADGTELTLVHERLDALRAAMPEVAGNVSIGWGMALDKLPSALEA